VKPSRRALTEAERRLLSARIRSLSARSRRSTKISPLISAGVVLLLWLWTMLASDAQWILITAFWFVVGGGITLWVRRDMRTGAGALDHVTKGLESGLRRNAADVYDVRASSFVEFEEVEDEGACYVFDVGESQLLVITGQGFYEAARFPSLDFSLVYVLDENDATVDMLIDKRGEKAGPARRIPAAIKQTLEIPEHLDVRTGSLDALEQILR
jgi:hypothetical protein